MTRSFVCPASLRGRTASSRRWYWDFRVEKRTKLATTTNLDIILDVFNLLNRNTVVRVQTLNIDLENYLRPAQILSPRAARVALRLTF